MSSWASLTQGCEGERIGWNDTLSVLDSAQSLWGRKGVSQPVLVRGAGPLCAVSAGQHAQGSVVGS